MSTAALFHRETSTLPQLVSVHLLPRHNIARVWKVLLPGIEIYREKTPHFVGSVEQVWENLLSEGGDELLVIAFKRRYAGFITFHVLDMEGERWATVLMIYVDQAHQRHVEIMREALEQFKDLVRERGCTHINYFTARRGFQRLAPRLGFRQRIVEWVMEV